MCDGFGGIITRLLQLYWSEPDKDGDCSHSVTIERMGIEDNKDIFLRNFARWQCPDWTIASFEFDEESTLPGWVEENKQEIINKVSLLLAKAFPLWAEYERVRDNAFAEYKRVRDNTWAEYRRVEQTAMDEMMQSMRKLSGFVAEDVIDDQN